MANEGRETNGERLAQTISTAAVGSAVNYPSWLSEDAPHPDTNRRSQEPTARIALLAQTIDSIRQDGVAETPIAVGTLYVLANQTIRRRDDGAREFSFVEFKAVLRCTIMDPSSRFALSPDGRVDERDSLNEEVNDEEEIVRLIREGMIAT